MSWKAPEPAKGVRLLGQHVGEITSAWNDRLKAANLVGSYDLKRVREKGDVDADFGLGVLGGSADTVGIGVENDIVSPSAAPFHASEGIYTVTPFGGVVDPATHLGYVTDRKWALITTESGRVFYTGIPVREPDTASSGEDGSVSYRRRYFEAIAEWRRCLSNSNYWSFEEAGRTDITTENAFLGSGAWPPADNLYLFSSPRLAATLLQVVDLPTQYSHSRTVFSFDLTHLTSTNYPSQEVTQTRLRIPWGTVGSPDYSPLAGKTRVQVRYRVTDSVPTWDRSVDSLISTPTGLTFPISDMVTGTTTIYDLDSRVFRDGLGKWLSLLFILENGGTPPTSDIYDTMVGTSITFSGGGSYLLLQLLGWFTFPDQTHEWQQMNWGRPWGVKP